MRYLCSDNSLTYTISVTDESDKNYFTDYVEDETSMGKGLTTKYLSRYACYALLSSKVRAILFGAPATASPIQTRTVISDGHSPD